MYLIMCTRPDLAYPLRRLARYVVLGWHRKVHLDAAKRVLRYLCSTSGMGLVLGGRGPVVLTGHADASWVDDSATQRSSQGSLGPAQFLGGLPVGATLQFAFDLLSECVHACVHGMELCWLTYLLTNLGEQPRSPPVLYVDNKAMIALCQEHRPEHRMKHIALRYFLARELQQRGQLRLAYVATRANTADVFTKALPPGDHQRFITVLGLSFANGVLRSRAAHSPGEDGEKRRAPPMKGGGEAPADGAGATPANGEQQPAATLADGAPHLAARQGDGALPAKARGEEEEIEAEPPDVPLGRPPCRDAPALPPPDIQPGSDPWDTIDRGNEPSTPEFLALMLMTANDEEAVEAAAKPAQAPDKDPAEAHPRYIGTSGSHADNAIWHQRLGHPSRVTLKNSIEAGVFAPGDLQRPGGIEVRGVTHLRNYTVCHEVALSRQPSPLLEPGTNCYAKQEKVYSAAKFRSKEMQYYLAKKGIEHHVSLPYAHQQQGVAERTNRTLMTKVRALMKQSKLPPTYWTYAMHHAVRLHNLLSTTAITGNSSPHVKWTRTKGNTSMLCMWGCMVQYRPPTSTIGKFTSRTRWGIHLSISHEHKAWLILDLMSPKIKNARDVIFYEWLFLRQFREDEKANANRIYANN
ncbi:unnamed protein product [Closterium sp. NIES-53]